MQHQFIFAKLYIFVQIGFRTIDRFSIIGKINWKKGKFKILKIANFRENKNWVQSIKNVCFIWTLWGYFYQNKNCFLSFQNMCDLRIELVNILPIFQINLTFSFDATSSVVAVVQLCKLCLKIDHFARYVYHICKYPQKSYQHQKLVCCIL